MVHKSRIMSVAKDYLLSFKLFSHFAVKLLMMLYNITIEKTDNSFPKID